MSALDIVTKLDKEICGGELAKAAAYLADDFRFVGVGPQPLNKAEALGVWATIRAGLPDFSHNMRVVRESSNMVYAPSRRGAPTRGRSRSQTAPPCRRRSARGKTRSSASPSPCAMGRSRSGPSRACRAEAWLVCSGSSPKGECAVAVQR